MSTEVIGIIIEGLAEAIAGPADPVKVLAAYLNAHTPEGVHFDVVGGIDPQPLMPAIIRQIEDAIGTGNSVVAIGHSKGAMACFYIADELKRRGLRLPLMISIDSTYWGSNVPGTVPWSIVFGANAGKWLAADSVDYWMHYWQPGAPGGGQAFLAPGNHTTDLAVYQRGENHLAIVTAPEVMEEILAVVRELVA